MRFRTHKWGGNGANRRRCWFVQHGLSWVCLLLLLAFAWQSRGPGYGVAKTSKAWAELGDDVPDLDSFSEPGLAAAVLQKHIQNLYFTFTLGQEGTNRSLKDRNDSTEAQLGELQRRIRGLHGELLRDLLAVHYQNDSWSDFLDCYLGLLTVAPEEFDPAFWARSALACSQVCGRTDEVLDALKHFTRFSKDTNLVRRLEVTVEEWNREKIHPLATIHPPVPENRSPCLAANPSAASIRAEP